MPTEIAERPMREARLSRATRELPRAEKVLERVERLPDTFKNKAYDGIRARLALPKDASTEAMTRAMRARESPSSLFGKLPSGFSEERPMSVGPTLALAERTRRQWVKQGDVPLEERRVPDTGELAKMVKRLRKRIAEHAAEKKAVPRDGDKESAYLRTTLADGEALLRRTSKNGIPYRDLVAFAYHFNDCFCFAEELTSDRRTSGFNLSLRMRRTQDFPFRLQYLPLDKWLSTAPLHLVWVTSAPLTRAELLHAQLLTVLPVADRLVDPYDGRTEPSQRTPVFSAQHDAGHSEVKAQGVINEVEPNPNYRRGISERDLSDFKNNPKMIKVIASLNTLYQRLLQSGGSDDESKQMSEALVFVLAHENNGSSVVGLRGLLQRTLDDSAYGELTAKQALLDPHNMGDVLGHLPDAQRIAIAERVRDRMLTWLNAHYPESKS